MKLKQDPCTFLGESLDVQNFKPLSSGDPLAINSIDYIELLSASAKQTAYYLIYAFGFTPIAYRGPETAYREAVSYVLKQGEVVFIVTGSLRRESKLASEIFSHGLTVHDVALNVPHGEAFYYETIHRGAESVVAPRLFSDDSGSIKSSAIKTYGDVKHSIVERSDYHGLFWPGYVSYELLFPKVLPSDSVGLSMIDHVVGNVELGQMERWVNFYEKVLGFKELVHFSDEEIHTEYSALMSKVVNDGSGRIKFPINEPAKGKRKSQIDEYLDFHVGPGVQHIAFRTNDIISTITSLKARGVDFLRIPDAYYEAVPKRVGKIKEDLTRLQELGVLVDRDDDGYLLQIFTKPLHDRPTLFFEIIQREGSQGFGVGNFKALFEAIEREQALRGNL